MRQPVWKSTVLIFLAKSTCTLWSMSLETTCLDSWWPVGRSFKAGFLTWYIFLMEHFSIVVVCSDLQPVSWKSISLQMDLSSLTTLASLCTRQYTTCVLSFLYLRSLVDLNFLKSRPCHQCHVRPLVSSWGQVLSHGIHNCWIAIQYNSPSILQSSILGPPLIIWTLDVVPKGNFLC